MIKMRYISLFILFSALSSGIMAQGISFENILEGVNNPTSNVFIETLKDNRYIKTTEYKNRFKPEIWALNYNPVNNGASLWVHYNLNREAFEKKKKKSIAVDVKVISFGEHNKLHTSLENQIREVCRFGGTFTDESEGYWYNEYIHESGAEIRIYSMNEENYITVHKTVKIPKE